MLAYVHAAAASNGPMLAEVPDPIPAAGELLVAVRAVGLNRADLQRRAGFYGGGTSGAHVAGLELTGEVIALGRGVDRFKVGDRVMAAAASACATLAVVHECMACRVPRGYAWEEAAATYVCLATAHDALKGHANLQAGEQVLVQGAASGVGIGAVQVARLLGAGRIVGTSRSRAKLDRLLALGLDDGLTYGETAQAGEDAERPASLAADVIVDLVGSTVAAHSLRSLGQNGRWVSVGRLTASPASIDLGVLAHKRGSLIGMASRVRTHAQHRTAIDSFCADVMAALESRSIVPTIDSVFAWDTAPAAFERLAAGDHFGKIVISVG